MSIKKFLSPIEGGHYDGMTFKTFMKNPQRWFLLSIFPIVMVLMAIYNGPGPDWDPEWLFYFAEGFLFLIWCVAIGKGIIQHWSDLKKHTSR
jgi:hypothetical protein